MMKNLNYFQVMKEALNYVKIRRSCWEDGHYWVINKDTHLLINSKGNSVIVNRGQINANDWEVVEDKFCLDKKYNNICIKDLDLQDDEKENIKIDKDYDGGGYVTLYYENDVKEFIKLLKKEIDDNLEFCNRDGSNKKNSYTIYKKLIKIIDKIAGDKLI